MESTRILFLFAVVGFTLLAAVADLRTRKLPNWLTVPAFLAALAFHGLTGGWAGLTFALGGFASGFGVLLVLWLIGGGGGGDVKLMGALGAWLGARLTIYVFLLSTVLALLGSVVLLGGQLMQHGFGRVRRRHFSRPGGGTSPVSAEIEMDDLRKQLTQRRLLPYALPVAVGTWLILIWQSMIHPG